MTSLKVSKGSNRLCAAKCRATSPRSLVLALRDRLMLLAEAAFVSALRSSLTTRAYSSPGVYEPVTCQPCCVRLCRLPSCFSSRLRLPHLPLRPRLSIRATRQQPVMLLCRLQVSGESSCHNAERPCADSHSAEAGRARRSRRDRPCDLCEDRFFFANLQRSIRH